MRTYLIFLKIAEKDLEAAKYLFDRKLYSYSIFYLQQSIEKAVKSFGIRNKTITETEAKDAIGHKAWKVYSKIFHEVKHKITKFEKRLEVFPRLKETSLIKELKINELKKNLVKYKKVFPNEEATWNISFSREELHNIITEINEIRKLRESLSEIKPSEKEIEDFKEKLYEFFDVISEINPTDVEEAKKGLDNAITPEFFSFMFKKLPISELIFCYLSLFYLSLVFSPHAVRSRYPRDNFNPLKVYNEKMPLIQMLDSFIKIAEETLEKLNYIYAEMPEFRVKK